jgi:hypothetical protein
VFPEAPGLTVGAASLHVIPDGRTVFPEAPAPMVGAVGSPRTLWIL